MPETFYLHCGNGCGRRTTLGSSPGGATGICPNCGEGGCVVLGSQSTAPSTEGYTSAGVPILSKGTPFNRSQHEVAKSGVFHSWRSPVAKSQ